MNEDQFREEMKEMVMSIAYRGLLLNKLHTFPEVHLELPGGVEKMAEIGIDKPIHLFWKCGQCEETHHGVGLLLYMYDNALQKWSIGGEELSGAAIWGGYRHLGEIMVSGSTDMYVIFPGGRMRKIDRKHFPHILRAMPLTEEVKVQIMMNGVTPEMLGRKDWEG